MTTNTVTIKDKDIINSIVHEIKNPIALIKANIELVQLQCDSFDKNFDIIKRELDYLENLSCNYLTSYKNAYIETIFLAELINYIIYEYKNTYPNIKFNIIDSENVKIKGDKNMIGMVFRNIFKNCIEAILNKESEENIGKIFTKINVIGDEIKVAIIDDGVGFDENSENNGTGIGMKIIKKVMELHKGNYKIFNLENTEGTYQEIIFDLE
ncbi:MAG: ATP-binding protein [Lachnospirales bacterium]